MDAQFRQKIEDYVGLHLKLAGQLVDADFTHSMTSRCYHANTGIIRQFFSSFFRTPQDYS